MECREQCLYSTVTSPTRAEEYLYLNSPWIYVAIYTYLPQTAQICLQSSYIGTEIVLREACTGFREVPVVVALQCFLCCLCRQRDLQYHLAHLLPGEAAVTSRAQNSAKFVETTQGCLENLCKPSTCAEERESDVQHTPAVPTKPSEHHWHAVYIRCRCWPLSNWDLTWQ